MTRRAEAVEDTRCRIVEATLALHAEQGISGTSWEAIAARAGVGVGTVYRHFRSYDELLPACGALTREKLALPDLTIFDGTADAAGRLHCLTEALFALYARGAAELRNIRAEADLHPAVSEAGAEIEARIEVLLAAAVPDPARRPLVRALTDLGTWQSLRRARVPDPVHAVTRLLASGAADPGT